MFSSKEVQRHFSFYNSQDLCFFSATTIVEAAKDKQNPGDFAEALDTVLGDFAFPDVFLFDIWGALGDVKNGRV